MGRERLQFLEIAGVREGMVFLLTLFLTAVLIAIVAYMAFQIRGINEVLKELNQFAMDFEARLGRLERSREKPDADPLKKLNS